MPAAGIPRQGAALRGTEPGRRTAGRRRLLRPAAPAPLVCC